jgi:uncharacterized protein YegJ (DUF2314 family)
VSERITFKDLVGKTLARADKAADDRMEFETDSGEVYALYHDQNCCEYVAINDICGELSDLVGSPILQAEESTSNENPQGVEMGTQDSFMWTFYRMATQRGSVVIRWYGESNGYYSESVDFAKV